MRIVYDDLTEFVEARLRCEKTRLAGECNFCPFCDRCQIDSNENLHVMCCDILSMQQPIPAEAASGDCTHKELLKDAFDEVRKNVKDKLLYYINCPVNPTDRPEAILERLGDAVLYDIDKTEKKYTEGKHEI